MGSAASMAATSSGEEADLVASGGPADLYAAAEVGDVALVQKFIAAGADLRYRRPPLAYDALKIAIVGGHLEVCRLLLDAGADVKLIDMGGASAGDIALKRTKFLGGANGTKVPPKADAQQIHDLVMAHVPLGHAHASHVMHAQKATSQATATDMGPDFLHRV